MTEFHQHRSGDVVQGEAARCIDPDAGAVDVFVLTREDLAAREAAAVRAYVAEVGAAPRGRLA